MKNNHRNDARQNGYGTSPLFPTVGESNGSYPPALYPAAVKSRFQHSARNAFEVLRRQKWVALGIFGVVLGLVAWFTLRQTPVYQADTLLLVSTERSFNPDDALSYGHLGSIEDLNATAQMVILEHSEELARRTAERLIAQRTVPETGEPISLLPAEGDVDADALARALQGGVVTATLVEPSVIMIAATSPNPREAAYIANVYAEEAMERSKDASRRRVSSSRQFLEDQRAESEAALSEAESNLQDYMTTQNAVALDQEVQSTVATLARLEADLAQAQIELDMRQASVRSTEEELRRLKPMMAERVASGIDSEIQAAQARLAELELRLEEIYQNYPDLRGAETDDARTKTLRTQIAQWRSRIDELSRRYLDDALAAGSGTEGGNSGVAYVAGLERRLVDERIAASGLQAKMAALRKEMAKYSARLGSVPRQSIQLAQLQRERAAAEQLYGYLEQRLKEAQIAEEAEIGSLRLLRGAFVPSEPVYPNTGRSLLLGSLLGLLAAIGFVSLRSRLDGRIFSPSELRERGMHLLSVVPQMEPHIRKLHGKKTSVDVNGRRVHVNLVALTAPYTAVAEAYRHLYTRMQFSLPDRVVKTVVVTSAEAAAGKSTTSINLAITTARAQRRTLIIDLDMRRPAVHRYLGIDKGYVLQDLLAMPLDENVIDRVIPDLATGIDNLYALTVRQPVPDPIEQLTSAQMRRLIDLLTERFDVVIFDTPPVLLASDAALLAPYCDATLVVASSSSTQADGLVQVAEELDEAGANIMGIVLNRFDPSSPTTKHTYGYRQRNYSKYYQYAE